MGIRGVLADAALAAGVLVSCIMMQGSTARADDYTAWRDIETKYIFGFTTGSGIGLEGEKEFTVDAIGRFGKREGSYSASETKYEFEFTPSQFVQIEFGALGSTHDIHNVPDLDDRRQVALAGGFAEFRYLAIERTSSNPLAVTLAVEPTFRRIDETGGERIRNFELETTINADLELVKNRLFAGFNFLYEPEVTRTALSETEREAKLGGSAALAWRVTPDVVIGGEVWYLRHYDSFGLQDFTGDAVMLGPTLYVRLAPKMFMTAAWNTQVWVAKSAIRFRSISPSFSATVHGSSSPSNSDIQHRRYPHVICTHCSSPFGGLRYCDRMEGKP